MGWLCEAPGSWGGERWGVGCLAAHFEDQDVGSSLWSLKQGKSSESFEE